MFGFEPLPVATRIASAAVVALHDGLRHYDRHCNARMNLTDEILRRNQKIGTDVRLDVLTASRQEVERGRLVAS